MKQISTSSVTQFKVVLYVILALPFYLRAQQSYTFTSCGAVGNVGPTQMQVNTAYASTNLNGSVTVSGMGIQSWTVPTSGMYRVSARGAQGAGANGGFGALMAGDFSLTANDVIRIVVGQQGVTQSGEPNACGGGGGSYVIRNPGNALSNILVIAGGGGGSAGTYSISRNASIGTAGNNGAGIDNTDGAGGTNGNGGNKSVAASSLDRAAGGGGYFTDGQSIAQSAGAANGGSSFSNGSGGGTTNTTGANGGFGGGGAVWTTGFRGAGGGGGFSGGGGGQTNSNTNTQVGGGGGSYNNGTNQANVVSTSTGDGVVVITELCDVRIFASGSNSLNPSICSGQSITLTTNSTGSFTWSTGNTSNTSIVVNPTSTQTYSIVGTGSLNCIGQVFMTVNVSAALPVISITNTPGSLCLGKTATLTAGGALTYTWTNGVVNAQTFTPTVTQTYVVTGQNGCGTATASAVVTIAPLSVTTVASSTLVCQGSSALLTATAAATGYTWQPGNVVNSVMGVVPSSLTVYTVTATDGTCSGVATITVDTKVTPTLTAVGSNTEVCEGGVVTITVSGAQNYSWSPVSLTTAIIQVTPSISTGYIVTGTNSVGCSANTAWPVIVKQAVPVNVVTNRPMVCPGGPSTLIATGAVSYTWAGGPNAATYIVNPTVPTVYSVSAAGSNSCVANKTIAVNVFSPIITVAPANSTICLGQQVVLTLSGANTYSLNGVIGVPGSLSPTANTQYTVSATSNSAGVNCVASALANVVVNALPTVSISATKTVMCRNDAPAKLTASGASVYAWSNSATSSTINAPSNSVNTLIYSVVGTDGNGCTGTASLQVRVNACTGIEESAELAKLISVFPNPTSGNFTISSQIGLELYLMNELGQQVQKINLSPENNYQVKVNDLAAGIYFVTGQQGKQEVHLKIIVSK